MVIAQPQHRQADAFSRRDFQCHVAPPRFVVEVVQSVGQDIDRDVVTQIYLGRTRDYIDIAVGNNRPAAKDR